MEFFRHCPECGRRFHIKVVDKKVVAEHRESIEEHHEMKYDQLKATPVLVVSEPGPIYVDIEEFQYSYKCKHCEHEWTEKHLVEHREGRRSLSE
jgi:DNA-directed RNA polymerase subunit RPC12/RpoP